MTEDHESRSHEDSRSIGRIEGKLDILLVNLKDLQEEIEGTKQRVSALEKIEAKAIGIALAVATALSLGISWIADFFKGS